MTQFEVIDIFEKLSHKTLLFSHIGGSEPEEGEILLRNIKQFKIYFFKPYYLLLNNFNTFCSYVNYTWT